MEGINKAALIIVSLILISPWFTGVKTNMMKSQMTAQDHNPILFLHGWGGNWALWRPMMEMFETDGWLNTTLYAKSFSNPKDHSIPAMINNANKISTWVDEILNETDAEKIDIVSHSMGGHSSRYYIKFLGGIDKVDDYVSLGCDHHGGRVLYFPYPNQLILDLNEGDETPGGVLNDTLGDRYDAYWGVTYNGTHIPGNISYTSIYSREDRSSDWDSCVLHGATNIEVRGKGILHMDLLEDAYIYSLVKIAVGDYPQTTTIPTQSTTTTTTTTDDDAPGFDIGILILILFLNGIYYQKRR